MSLTRALCICLVLFVSVVLGCAYAEPVKITIWEPYPERESFRINQELASDFTKLHPDIQVEVLGVDQGTYPNKFIPAVIAGAGPDVFVLTYVWVGYAARGLLLDLAPYAKRDGVLDQIKTDIYPGAQTGIWWQGGLYAIPKDVGGGIMYYNPTLLAESGVAEPKVGWTWDDWWAMSKRIRRTDGDGKVTTHGTMAISQWSGVLPMWTQAGVSFFSSDFRKAVINNNEGIRQALTFVGDMVDAGLYSYAVNYKIKTADAFGLAASGKVGLWMDTPRPKDLGAPVWANFKVAPSMRMPGGSPSTYAHWTSWAAVKSGDAKREAAAWEFIKWVTATEQQAKEVANRGLTSDLPARRSVLQHRLVIDIIRRDANWTQIIQNVIPHGRTEGLFGAPIMDQFQTTVLNPALAKAIAVNRTPVPERVENLQFDTQKLLDDFWHQK